MRLREKEKRKPSSINRVSTNVPAFLKGLKLQSPKFAQSMLPTRHAAAVPLKAPPKMRDGFCRQF